ncbi:peptidase-like protein [Flavobacteriales bacterium ALC-1]|nr:peptidase-like protein [Flavobacteriales bacterium ALC-1]
MKQLLLLFGLTLSIFSFSQTFSGSLNTSCNVTISDNTTHDLIAPNDSRLELSGVFNVTGGLCSGNGSADVSLSISASAIWTDENGNEVQQNIGATGTLVTYNPTLITNTVPAGTLIRLYFSLSVYNGQFANAPYTFNAVFPNFLYADDIEPNNSYDQAIATSEGIFYEGHGTMDINTPVTAENTEDWYKLVAPRNGTLTIYTNSHSVIPDNAGVNTNLYVMRSDTNGFTAYSNSSYFLSQNSTTSNSNTVINCVKEGDIIYLNYIGNSNSYRFLWGISEPSGFIDNEPNNDIVGAITIDNEETKTGNLGFGLTIDTNFQSTEDIDDWYIFTMPDTGDIDININSEGSLFPLQNYFYIEDDNGELAAMPLNGNQIDGYYGTCLTAGTYYFKLGVSPDNTNGALANGNCEGCCLTYSVTLNLSNLQTSNNDFEPNNTVNEAEFANANIDYEGQLGATTADGLDNQDIYELSIDYNGDLSINFIEPHPQGNAYMTSFNGSFQEPIGTTNLDTNNMITSISYNCAAAGESYYLYINATECSTYSFNYTNTYYGDNNENEPNDIIEDAQLINNFDTIFGQLNYGAFSFIDSADYYILNITESAPITIDFSIEDYTTVSLIEDSGQVASVSQNPTTGLIESLTYNNIDVSKSYYLEIINTSGECVNYDLLGWQQLFTANNDVEPNNEVSQATAINFNQVYSGQLSYYTANSDSQDFYSFTLNENDDVEFVLNAFEGLANTVSLTLYDMSGNQIFQLFHDGVNSSRTSNTINLNMGDYYFVIGGVSQTGSYEFNVIPQNSLSTNENTLDNLVSVYPIPTKSKINIKLSYLVNSINSSIYDVTGKLINTYILKNSINEVDISALENGIYFIQLKSDNASITIRFIKQ